MVKLNRSLSLFNITVAGIGITLGAGIYALIGIAAGFAGNATWLGFLISAIIAIFTGLSYAELSTLFKGDAGEYDYLSKAFNKKFAFIISLFIIFAGAISVSTVALGFAGYLSSLIPISFLLGAFLIILLMSWINFIGIKETNTFNMVSTLIEFIGLAIIIFLGITRFGSVNYLDMPNGFSGVLSSTAIVFFAYLGFESIIKLREETKDPEKNIPKALMFSVLITSLIYVLVAISAVSIIGWSELANSEAPLASVAAAIFGSPAFIVLAVIALFSTSNTVLLNMVVTSRMLYGMAKRKSMPKLFSRVHKKTRTPHFAIITLMLLAIIFMLIGDISLVASLTNLFVFIVFGSVNLSLIILRYKDKRKRGFYVPLNIGKFPIMALLGFLSSTFMIFFVIKNLIG